MAEKQNNRERLKEITDRIEAGIQEMFQSGNVKKYEAYLRTMGRFHRYSVNNVMLILMQRPDSRLLLCQNVGPGTAWRRHCLCDFPLHHG